MNILYYTYNQLVKGLRVFKNTFTCNNCSSYEIFEYNGEFICRKCGAVQEKTFAPIIWIENRQTYKNTIPVGTEPSYHGIRYIKYNKNYKSYPKKHLKMLYQVCEQLNLSNSVVNEAKRILERLVRTNKRKRIHLLVLAAVYAASKNFDLGLSLKNIIYALNELGFYVRKRKLKIIYEVLRGLEYNSKIPSIEKLIVNILNRLIIDEEIGERVEEFYNSPREYAEILFNTSLSILMDSRDEWKRGKNPRTIATCLVYLSELLISLQQKRKCLLSQRLLSEISGVSEYTIRERVIEYYKMHDAFHLSLRGRRSRCDIINP